MLEKSAIRVKLSDISLNEEHSSHRGKDAERIHELKSRHSDLSGSCSSVSAWLRFCNNQKAAVSRFFDGDYNCSLFARPSLLCDETGGKQMMINSVVFSFWQGKISNNCAVG